MATTFDAVLRLRGSDETGEAFRSAAQASRRFKQEQHEASRGMQADIDSVGKAMRGLRRTVAIGGITAALTDSIRTANTFGSAVERIGIRANLSDAQVKALAERLRSESQRTLIPVNDLVKGFEAYRRASGQSAEEAIKNFQIVGTAAQYLEADVEKVGTFAGRMMTDMKIPADRLEEAFDMIGLATEDIPFEEFAQNFEGYMKQARSLGLEGVAGLKQMLAGYIAVNRTTRDSAATARLFGAIMDKATDADFLSKRFEGGLLAYMKAAIAQGRNVVDVIGQIATQGGMTDAEWKQYEAYLRDTFGPEVYKVLEGVRDGTIDIEKATYDLGQQAGRTQTGFDRWKTTNEAALQGLKLAFDDLKIAVGDTALSLDKKLGKVFDDLFGGDKTGSAVRRLTKEIQGISKVVSTEGGIENWLKGQLDQARVDYEKFAADIQKLFTLEGATAAFENFSKAFNDFAAKVGLDKWWAAQLEQMKNDAEAFWESIKKLFTWEGLKGVWQKNVGAAQEALAAGEAKTAQQVAGVQKAPGYNPWTGQTVAAMQAGGPVGRGRPYIVGERGPELFIPNAGGRIAPATAGGTPVDSQTYRSTELLIEALHALGEIIQRETRQRRQLSLAEAVQQDERVQTVGQALGGAPRPSVMPGAAAETQFGARIPTPVSLTRPDVKSRAAYAMNYFQEQGWSHAQAAGIVANLYHESKFRPEAVGDRGLAHGIAQWHPDRRNAIERVFGKPVGQMTFEEQLAAVQWEKTQGPEQAAGRRLRGAETAAQAGGIVSQYYERPLRREYEAQVRGVTAASFAQQFAPPPGTRPVEPMAPPPRAPEEAAAAAPAPPPPQAPPTGGREFGADIFADVQAQREAMQQPLTIPVTFEYQPGENAQRQQFLRRDFDRQVREAQMNSYSDVSI